MAFALDIPEASAADYLTALRGLVDIIKLPPSLLYIRGEEIIREVRSFGFQVFADVKLHDIPSTVARASEALSRAGADYITIHLAGGPSMIHSAVSAVSDRSTILGVAVLTSLSPGDQQLVFRRSGVSLVLDQFAVGADAGIHGFVCPPSALRMAREKYPRVTSGGTQGFVLVVPGLRWDSQSDDQADTMSPEDAVRSGADMIVLGRALLRAFASPDFPSRLRALKNL
ncbi:MAG: orotidine-5'-phosphate decarboxylase [bacterium JZ-2024 1]